MTGRQIAEFLTDREQYGGWMLTVTMSVMDAVACMGALQVGQSLRGGPPVLVAAMEEDAARAYARLDDALEEYAAAELAAIRERAASDATDPTTD